MTKLPSYHHQTYETDLSVLRIAVEQLNRFLGLSVGIPQLFLVYDSGPSAQTKIIDGVKRGIILRPEKSLLRYQSPCHHPEVIIHELVHIMEDDFLGLAADVQRETDTAVYLSEGLANFLANSLETGIYQRLDISPREDFTARIKSELKNNPLSGQAVLDFASFDKLYVTRQKDLETQNPDADPQLLGKLLAPYYLGPLLIKFIFQKGGIESIKRVMKSVQVEKRLALGWNLGPVSQDELGREEKRVRVLFKKAIKTEFGDVDDFEKNWKQSLII